MGMELVPSSTPDYTENVRITRGVSWRFLAAGEAQAALEETLLGYGP